jgi:hypothetical protein
LAGVRRHPERDRANQIKVVDDSFCERGLGI